MTNAIQGMQYDQPCSWNAQISAIALLAASITAGAAKKYTAEKNLNVAAQAIWRLI
jgi:hypothetical protein